MHRTMQRTVNSDTSRVTRAVSTVEIKPWSKSIDCITRESDTCECRRAILRRVTKIALFSTRHGPHKSRNARRYARIAERDRSSTGRRRKKKLRIVADCFPFFSIFFFIPPPQSSCSSFDDRALPFFRWLSTKNLYRKEPRRGFSRGDEDLSHWSSFAASRLRFLVLWELFGNEN